MFPMRRADVPLYVQLKHHIRSMIASGELKPGDALPGERELVAKFGLSRTTVRQALGDLVAEGLLYRHHGKGTFVAPHDVKRNPAPLADVPEVMRSMGHAPTVEVLTCEKIKPPGGVAAALGLAADAQTTFIVRLVHAEGEPVVVVRTYLVESVGNLIHAEDLAVEPMYSRLERLGYPVHEGLQTIGATRLHPRDAALLAVEPGTPALLLQRVTFIDPGAPVEYSEAMFRADRFQYQTQLRRTASSW
ncbi:MAG: GntR family transcriptional regulator [Firmicutes bacterium]|jgi:GntR family transcriptional regulator|nr:GntR family transcriptional regulator [Bacillota bacterium]